MAKPEPGSSHHHKPRFEYFDHAADVGLRGFGATPERAFEAAAAALFGLMDESLENVREVQEEEIRSEAPDLAELLVAFLNELISLSDSRRLIFRRFRVEIDTPESSRLRLTARAWGERYEPARHRSIVEPKGATYTALRVASEADGWIAQCVVDV
jgi:SHS2 domain-containing protein